jgi:hypothetical protein
MAVPVGCWPNANAVNSSRPAPFFFFLSRANCFFDGPHARPHAKHYAAPCGPMRPHAAPCTGVFRWDPRKGLAQRPAAHHLGVRPAAPPGFGSLDIWPLTSGWLPALLPWPLLRPELSNPGPSTLKAAFVRLRRRTSGMLV